MAYQFHRIFALLSMLWVFLWHLVSVRHDLCPFKPHITLQGSSKCYLFHGSFMLSTPTPTPTTISSTMTFLTHWKKNIFIQWSRSVFPSLLSPNLIRKFFGVNGYFPSHFCISGNNELSFSRQNLVSKTVLCLV